MSNFLFQVQAKELLAILKNTKPLVSKKFPLNKIVIFKKNENGLTVTLQQFKVTLNQELKVPTSQEDFTLFVSFSSLNQALKGAKGLITFSTGDDPKNLNIAYGPIKKTIPIVSEDDFNDNELYYNPDIPINLIVSEAQLLVALKAVVHSISTDATKQVLTHLNLSISEDNLTLASTDGYRLTTSELKCINLTSIPSNLYNIPIIAVKSLISLMNPKAAKSEEISISFNHEGASDMRIQISGKNFSFALVVWEINYPNYKQLIPTKFSYEIEIPLNKEVISFLKSLKDFKDVTLGQNSEGYLFLYQSLTGDTLTCPIPQLGEFPKINFNPRYLSDSLESLLSENKELTQVKLEFLTPNSPAVIRVANTTHLLMPIQIKGQ